MVLKIGKRCTWDEIKVGEVFGVDGCFAIAVKRNKKTCLYLSVIPLEEDERWNGTIDFCISESGSNFYKLPKSVQQLWKEE